MAYLTDQQKDPQLRASMAARLPLQMGMCFLEGTLLWGCAGRNGIHSKTHKTKNRKTTGKPKENQSKTKESQMKTRGSQADS